MTPDLFIPTADPSPVPPSLSTLADLEVSLNRPMVTPEPLPTPAAPTPEPDLDQVDSLAGDILALNEQIDALTRKRDDLKATLLGSLQSSKIETLTTARVKITQVASARQVSLNVKPERLPEIYQVVKSDDVAIRKAIDAGVDLSAYLSLKPPTYYLKITPQHRR